MNLDNYEFKDIPLTPAVCRELIVELFAGKTVARNDIVTTVVETHVKLGGGLPMLKMFLARSKKR